jgi:hypothetical protein
MVSTGSNLSVGYHVEYTINHKSGLYTRQWRCMISLSTRVANNWLYIVQIPWIPLFRRAKFRETSNKLLAAETIPNLDLRHWRHRNAYSLINSISPMSGKDISDGIVRFLCFGLSSVIVKDIIQNVSYIIIIFVTKAVYIHVI